MRRSEAAWRSMQVGIPLVSDIPMRVWGFCFCPYLPRRSGRRSTARAFVTTKAGGSDEGLPTDKCVLDARTVSIVDHVSARLATQRAAAIVERISGSSTISDGSGGSAFQSGNLLQAGQLIGVPGLPLGVGLAR